VCSLQGQLNYDDVAGRIEAVQLAVHVRERRPVVDDRVTDVGAPVCDTDGLIRESSILGEAGYEALDVLFLSALIGPPDDLLGVGWHARFPSRGRVDQVCSSTGRDSWPWLAPVWRASRDPIV
jgi:hypothetical protein